jgi:hypothetical protein
MIRTRWLGLWAFALTLVLTGLVRSEESPLAQVPADSAIVLQIHGIDRSKDRLIAMIKTAVPDLAPMVEALIEQGLKEGMQGRQVKGLAKDGPHFLVFTEVPKSGEGLPKMALVLHLTRYGDFLDGFLKEDERKTIKPDKAGYDVGMVESEEFYFIDRKEYVVVTPNKECAEQLVKKGPGLDSKLNKEVAKKLLDADLAAYVNMEAINKEYGNQLQGARQMMQMVLPQAAGQIGKQTVEMMQAMYEGVFQFVEDSRVFLLTAELRPEGLALHVQTRVGADTKTNGFFKEGKKSSFDQLATLPAGQLGYTAFQLDPAIFKGLQLIMQGFMGDENKAVTEAMEQLAQVAPQSLLATFQMPIQGMQIWQCKDPTKAAAAQLKLFQALEKGESFQNAALKEKPEVKADAQNHRGFKLHYGGMVWDLEKTVEKQGLPQLSDDLKKQMVESMKKMLGEGVKTWFGTDGKTYVQISAKDWDTAKAQLDQYLDGKSILAKEKAYQEARKQLPSEATMIALVDALPYAQKFGDYMLTIVRAFPLPIQIPSIPSVTGKPAYLGMAVTVGPEQGSFDFWIPCSAVAEVRKLVEPMIRGAGN